MFRKHFALRSCAGGFLLFLTGTPLFGQSDALENAIRSLARRSTPMIQGGSGVCVDWQNRGAVSDLRSSELRSAFLAELPNSQGHEKRNDGSCDLRVLLDRTPTQYVLTAKVGSGGAERVLIGQVARSDISPFAASGSALRLQKELLWQQSGRILDAVQVDGADGRQAGFLVLAPDGASYYEMESARPRLRRS